jgi:hypothetical protein
MSMPNPEIIPHCILYENQGMTLEDMSRYLYDYDAHHNLERDTEKRVFNPAEAKYYLRLYEKKQFYDELNTYAKHDEFGFTVGIPSLFEPSFMNPLFNVRTVTHCTLGKEKVRNRICYHAYSPGDIDQNEDVYITRIIKDFGEKKHGRHISYVEQPIQLHTKTEQFNSYEELIATYPVFAIEKRFDLLVDEKIRVADRDSLKFFRTIQKKDKFYFDDEYLRDQGPASGSLPNGGFGPLGWTDFMLTLGFIREGYMHRLGDYSYYVDENTTDKQTLAYLASQKETIQKGKGVNDPNVKKLREKGIIDAMFSHFAKQQQKTHFDLLRMRLTPWDKSNY